MSLRASALRVSLALSTVLLILPGCAQNEPSVMSPTAETEVSIGALHNEFLDLVHELQNVELTKTASADALVTAANTIAKRYGHPPFDPDAVHAAVARGREMAQLDPDALVRQVLNDDEFEWWKRFALEATPTTARKVLADHTERFGAPIGGTKLAVLIDISISSAEYWYARHQGDTPIYENPYVARRSKGWRDRFNKWGRFAVAVAVDGVSGTITASGGGPVAGAIVGGLASYGADCLLFGCG